MTKKHIQLLAEALKASRPEPEPVAMRHFYLSPIYAQWQASVLTIANMCQGLNPHFNLTNFLETCRYEKN